MERIRSQFPRIADAGLRVVRLMMCVGLMLACGGALEAEERDPQAVEVAKRMMTAIGGENAWNDTQFVRFEFNVSSDGKLQRGRTHLWDKWTGRYRYESQTDDGTSQIVLFNVNDKKGRSYVDGALTTAKEETDKILDSAHGAFINDTYWLAMPWKWLDPGVNLKYVGQEEKRGEMCDVVKLSFESVGRTPGDTYLGYVSKKSGLMVHWSYKLQSDRKGAWDWEYVDAGGIKLARTHTNDEGREIHMGVVRVFDAVDDAYFNDRSKMLSTLK